MRFYIAYLVAALLSGCATDDGSDPHGGNGKTDEPSGLARFQPSWTLLGEGLPVACPEGFDTVAMYSQRINFDGTAVGSPAVDLFDCAAGVGETADLEVGHYRVWIQIMDHMATDMYAQSHSVIADLEAGNTSVGFTLVSDAGYFEMSWSLVGDATNAALECEDVADLAGIELVSTNTATEQVSVDVWSCGYHTATTGGLSPGFYTVAVAAINSNNESMGTSVVLADQLIEAPNRFTNLGAVLIPIDGM